MSTQESINQLTWQCRRGMLELDVILAPFLEQYFSTLMAQQQKDFKELLKQADPDIYTWIMGFGECKDAELAEIIQIIRNKMLIV